MNEWFALITGEGAWCPIAWLAGIIIALIIAYLIRMRGEDSYNKDSEQAKPFLAGASVKDYKHNMYWGFFESLKSYYKLIKKIHTGVINDYVLWFVIVMIFLLIMLSVGVMW